MMLASAAMLCLTSCVEEAADPAGQGTLPSNVATLQDQVSAMKSSVIEIESLQAELGEVPELAEYSAQLEACAVSVKEHISFVEAGLSGADAAIAAMNLQSRIAEATGTVKVALAIMDNDSFRKDILSIEKSVASWLGKDFRNHFDVSAEQSRLCSMIEVVDQQSLSIDAIASDVEAGLRVGDASSLKTVLASVGEASESLSTLNQKMTTLGAEVEKCYTDAIKSATPATKSALKAVNTKAAAAMEETGVTLEDLSNRIASCESDIAELDSRLEKVKADIKELLGMIQSATFLSEYSEEYVIAYYNMDNNSKVDAPAKPYDGKSLRTPVETIELNYMIRPVSAADAVTKDVVSVVGYYADRIQTQAIDPTKFVNFTVNDVSVTNAERGIVTVRMSHNLKDDFYYRETGAKCALFIATGQTNVASKFVEIYPKDKSTTVYVESIEINQDAFEIDEGQTKNLTATVNPSSATNKTITWTSSNTEIATIDQYSGVLTAVKQGNVTITATTNDINEWGDNLTASVNVKVNPAIRLGGPLYVEVGKTADLSLDFPPAMNIESKVWLSSDDTKATVENGVVTGVAHTYNEYTYEYNPITITCIVNGDITLTHEMSVVVPQPRQIKLNNYGDDVESVTMKLGQTISLAGSILPANVDANLFRLTYESDGGLGWIDFSSGEITSPGSVGGRYVYIKVKDIDKQTYMKTFVERTVIVNVEPYYVKTMTLPATFEMNLDQTATLPVTLTSDVEGKNPTYPGLKWTSSNSSVISIDETTGEMTSLKEGSVTITATTTHANAVPSGQAQKSASCIVTVKTPVAPIAIGDYFYSDGTWSTERDYSKTVIGIVFAKVNAAVSDVHMINDHPGCSNGLVVSTVEYTTPMVESGASWGRTIYFDWMNNNGYTQAQDTQKYSGYGTTKGLIAINSANVSNSYGTVYFDLCEPLLQHRNSVEAPEISSGWYLPSYQEMKLLYDNFDAVNASIQSVGGTVMTKTYTFTDTVASTPKTYTKDNQYYCAYVNNGYNWTAFNMNTSDMVVTGRYINDAWSPTYMPTAEWPVRVVLAF